MSKSKLFAFGFALLVVLNLAALYRIIRLKISQSSLSTSISIIEGLRQAALKDLDGKDFEIEPIDSAITLLIFFSPSDCHECLLEAPLWEKLYKRFGRNGLSVIGIASSFQKNIVRAFVQNNGLNFPVLYDPGGRETKKLGITLTPLKLVLNQWGEAIFIDPSYKRIEAQRALLAIVEYILNNKEAYSMPAFRPLR